MQEKRIFTQKEIVEIAKVIAYYMAPIKLEVNPSDNSIKLNLQQNDSTLAVLKKTDLGFHADYTNSNGEKGNIGEKEWNNFKYHITRWITRTKKDNPFEIEHKDNINKVSPNFYAIFKEAIVIDALGFKESSGMVFRKALEVITKDFLKNQLPNTDETVINNNTIGGIIFHFYDQQNEGLVVSKKDKFQEIIEELNELKNLFQTISNTFKIGNDFAHYERKLSKFTSEDMKTNILQIVKFINNKIENKILNEGFKSEKLI